jgi:CHAT domain-containing protein/Tfp pilus assembly protein PilF
MQYFSICRTAIISLLILCVSVCGSLVVLAQDADEAAIRGLTQKFFAAFEKEDIDSLMLIWQAKPTDFNATSQYIQKLFKANNRIDAGNLVIRDLKLSNANATVRVNVPLKAAGLKSENQPASIVMHSTLDFFKKDGVWKVKQFAPSADDLTHKLVISKSEGERRRILAAERELVTIELVKSLTLRARKFFAEGSYSDALDLSQLALEIATKLNDKAGMADALNTLGRIQLSQGNNGRALDYFHESIRIAKEIGDTSQVGSGLNSAGNALYSQGNYTQAMDYFQNSLEIARELGDKMKIGGGLLNIGNIYYSQGDYPRASDYFEQSLKLGYETKHNRLIATALNALGDTNIQQGNYARAFEYGQNSLKFAQESGDKESISNALHDIGFVYDLQGNYSQAMEQYQKSLRLTQELGAKLLISDRLNNIGAVYEAQGDYAQALEHYERSLALAEESGSKPKIAARLNTMGGVYKALGKSAQALEYYQGGLKLAQELGRKWLTGDILAQIASVRLINGEYLSAIKLADDAAAIARQIGSPEMLRHARTIAGSAYYALNRIEDARQAFDEAIAAIEVIRGQLAGGEQERERFFENKLSPYKAIVQLLVARRETGAALAYAERAKSRVLLDVLRSGKVNIARAMTSSEQEHERASNARVVSINSQIYNESSRRQPDATVLANLKAQQEKARRDYEAFHTSLYAAHPELRIQRGEAQPVNEKDIADLLIDANTALLEFVITDEKTYLFVATRNGSARQGALNLESYVINVSRKQLVEQVQNFRRQLATRNMGFLESARRLYDLLLKPAQGQIRNTTNLVIVPEAELWELSFQALQSAQDRFLVEDYAISYAPSLTVLREMIRVRKDKLNQAVSGASLMAIGNPALERKAIDRVKITYRGEELIPLPEAEREVKFLARLYGATRSKIYIGAEAREDRVKIEASQFSILHFATHSVFNDTSPMYSQIVLSQNEFATDEDGLLEAWEIMKMTLNAKLVVLSACETARGRAEAGEGVIGLTWAFFVSGSPTTVVSQWKVDSSSTTELMLEFHRNLKPKMKEGEREIGAAKALRAAELKLLRMNQFHHPFYWAAFIVVGDGG